jgi:co-chaperonin GroES (HSP10)
MNFRPSQDRVLIRRIEQEGQTLGDIIIPDTAKEKPMEGIEGEVVAAGPGARARSTRSMSRSVIECVRQVVRDRNQARRRRSADHEGIGPYGRHRR